MKRFLPIITLGAFFLALLVYAYVNSNPRLTEIKKNMDTLLIEAHVVESNVAKELLKSRSFSAQHYGVLVSLSHHLSKICERFKAEELRVYGKFSETLDSAIDRYCESIDMTEEKIETFKSKNATIKNSIFYINQLAREHFNFKNSQREKLTLKELALIHALNSFYITPSSDLQSYMKELMLKDPSRKNDDIKAHLFSHVDQILKNQEMLDTLVKSLVLSEESDSKLKAIEIIFENIFLKSNETAKWYRRILFWACVLLLGSIAVVLVRLLMLSKKLEVANNTLEQRVEERTHELNQTQKTVMDQQQALVSAAKLSSLGEMAGGIAHEINTPLAIIALRVDRLEKYIVESNYTSQNLLDSLAVIKRTTDRIANIISGLRAFARDGKTVPLQMVSAAHTIDDTLGLCQEKFKNLGIRLDLVKCPQHDELYFLGRSIEISQVLVNLLNNSYDAIEKLPEKWIKIETSEHEGFLEIAVTDSGKGIPLSIQEKMMQPFYTTKELGKGTGLGLSISKGIIDSCNGTLTVDNQCSNTKFVLRLPKAYPEPKSAA